MKIIDEDRDTYYPLIITSFLLPDGPENSHTNLPEADLPGNGLKDACPDRTRIKRSISRQESGPFFKTGVYFPVFSVRWIVVGWQEGKTGETEAFTGRSGTCHTCFPYLLDEISRGSFYRNHSAIQSLTVWFAAPLIYVILSVDVRRRFPPASMPRLSTRIHAVSRSPSTSKPFTLTVV